MSPYFKTLRPVGNSIRLQQTQLDLSQFGKHEVRFYQSGTAALAAALLAVKSTQAQKTNKPEVLLPAYTCPDLISACMFAGVKPILVDFEELTCHMSLSDIAQKITADTVAIIAVRFLGIAERMKDLSTICHEHGLNLIEDSAQGFPVNSPDTYWKGDLTIISFGRGKPVNLLGGGAVLTGKEFMKHLPPAQNEEKPSHFISNIKYCQKVRIYNLLINPAMYNIVTRIPGLSLGETIYKELSAIKALPYPIINYIAANIHHYQSLANCGNRWHKLIKSVSSTKFIDLPGASGHDFDMPLLRYPLLIRSEQHHTDIYGALKQFGVSVMYKDPLYNIKGIPQIVQSQGADLTADKTFAKALITLPTHSAMTENTQEEILNKICGMIN